MRRRRKYSADQLLLQRMAAKPVSSAEERLPTADDAGRRMLDSLERRDG